MNREETVVAEKRPDRRVVKTKRAIRNALAGLLAEKDVDTITIKDIADAADVNRKTVYNYYNGIYEILDEIENELVTAYQKLFQNIDFAHGLENPYKIFEFLTEALSENLDFYSRLLQIEANTKLVKKIISALEIRLKQELSAQEMFPPDKIDMIIRFCVSGMLGVYQLWFSSGRIQSLRDFSKDVGTLVLSGVQAFVCS